MRSVLRFTTPHAFNTCVRQCHFWTSVYASRFHVVRVRRRVSYRPKNGPRRSRTTATRNETRARRRPCCTRSRSCITVVRTKNNGQKSTEEREISFAARTNRMPIVVHYHITLSDAFLENVSRCPGKSSHSIREHPSSNRLPLEFRNNRRTSNGRLSKTTNIRRE